MYDDVICNIDFPNLYEKLKLLITDVDYRGKIAMEGRKLIERVNDPKIIASAILEKALSADAKAEQGFEYYPRFFSDHYQLPKNTHVSEINKKLSRRIIDHYQLAAQLNVKRMQQEGLI